MWAGVETARSRVALGSRVMAEASPPDANGSNGSTDIYVATYHDTPDRSLARARIALRRRQRDGTGLWEAMIGGETVEAPGGPASLPEELARRLTAPLRNRQLVEVVRLRNGAADVALMEGQRVLRTYRSLSSALR